MSIRKTIFLVSVSVIFLGASYFSYSRNVQNVSASDAPLSYLSGYAWSDTIGWISFTPATSGGGYIEVKGDGSIVGLAWSDNVGWIQLGDLATSSMPASPKVNATLKNGKLIGWVRACAGTLTGDCASTEAYPGGWDGWISLSGNANNGNSYGVSLLDAGSSFGWLQNYAWGSDILGWISFKGILSDNSTYGVEVVGENCGVDNSTIARVAPINAGNSWNDPRLQNGTLDASSQELFDLYDMSYDSISGTITTSTLTPTFDNPKITIHLTFDSPASSPVGCGDTYTRDATFSVNNPLIKQPTATSESKIQLTICKEPNGKCVDNGGISIPKGGSVKVKWIIGGGATTTCSGSSLGIPATLPGPDYIDSGEATIQNIQTTKTFSASCSGGGKSETKSVRAIILDVREF